MKKSKKKLAIAALLAGSVVVSATSCRQSNPAVYGPPEEFQTQKEEENGSGGTTGSAGEANSATGITNEAGTNSATGVTNGVFVPDDNINEDVYGPPADME
jgi:hypothetical protein